MNHYMLLLYLSERPAAGTPEGDAMFAAVRAFYGECVQRGALVHASPLEDPPSATTVRVRDGRALRTDGPFAETKEWLAGYFVVECRDREEAIELAALCPTAADGSVEVRALMPPPGAG
jgi:hypothetical protein